MGGTGFSQSSDPMMDQVHDPISVPEGYSVPDEYANGISKGKDDPSTFYSAAFYMDDLQYSTIGGQSTNFPMTYITPGGAYKFGNGTLLSPAISWLNDPTDGLYRIGSHDQGYVIGGALVTEWKSSEFRVNYLTPGSVVFAGTSGKLEQDNASFFWNDTSNFLKLESSLGKQIRLQYDSTTWSDFTVDINGNLYSTLTTGPQWIFKAFSPLFNITGTATNQAVTFRLVDNDTTLKSQLYYAGDAAAGSKATILQNYGGDYLQFQSNGSIRFTDKFAGTEYVRFLGNGDVSFGTGSFYWDNAAIQLQLLSTTSPLKLMYDASNYISFVVGSTGFLNIVPTGASGAVSNAATFTGDLQLQVFNLSNAAGTDSASLRAIVGGASSGDPYLRWGVNGVTNFVAGIDNSDSDSWKLCIGTAIGTSDTIIVTTGGSVGINTDGPDRRFDVLDASGNPQMRLTYTDNTNYCDFRVSSTGIFNIQPSSSRAVVMAASAELDITGSATNQLLSLQFYDNNLSTRKGRLLYAGSNAAGSRYFGFVNDGADDFRVFSTSSQESLRISSTLTTMNETAADIDFRIEGNSAQYMFFVDATSTTENIALLTTAAPNWQTGDKIIFFGDADTVPTGNPASGGFLYSEAGALKWRGSSGTITTIAPA